jgi:hypothetical protein
MKKLILLAALLWPIWKPALAEASSDVAVSNRVCVSTAPASPTTILSANRYATRTVLINNTTNYIMVGDGDTTFSTSDSTGTARIPANSSFSPDELSKPWQGTLKGVSSGSGCVTIDVIQTQ